MNVLYNVIVHQVGSLTQSHLPSHLWVLIVGAIFVRPIRFLFGCLWLSLGFCACLLWHAYTTVVYLSTRPRTSGKGLQVTSPYSVAGVRRGLQKRTAVQGNQIVHCSPLLIPFTVAGQSGRL